MVTDGAGEIFLGHYRRDVKTSIWRVNGTIAPPAEFPDIGGLLDSLPTDAVMTGNHPELVVAPDASDAEKLAAPATRFPQEQRNVTVGAYLWYIRKETDNDYHLILGSTADMSARYMTAEVSGLPAGGPDLDPLRQVRAQLVALAGSSPGSDRYEALTPPLEVRVTGSLFFDGDHRAGEVGPTGHKPQTVWEIHPVSDLQPL